MTVKRSSSSASSTSDRSKSMWGDTGVSSRQRCRGDTIGPRAENEYAVEPVGVATITPSAAYVVKKEPLIATSRRTSRPVLRLLDHRLVERPPPTGCGCPPTRP